MTKNEAQEIEDWWITDGKYQTGHSNTPSSLWPGFIQKAFKKLEEIENDDKKRSTQKIPSMD